jgi:hypothetical protein
VFLGLPEILWLYVLCLGVWGPTQQGELNIFKSLNVMCYCLDFGDAIGVHNLSCWHTFSRDFLLLHYQISSVYGCNDFDLTACDVVLFIQLRNPRRWMHASRIWLVQKWLPRLALVFSHIFSYFLGWSQFLSWWKHWWCWIRRTPAPWTSNKSIWCCLSILTLCFNFAIVTEFFDVRVQSFRFNHLIVQMFCRKYNHWYVLKNTQVGKAAPVRDEHMKQ